MSCFFNARNHKRQIPYKNAASATAKQVAIFPGMTIAAASRNDQAAPTDRTDASVGFKKMEIKFGTTFVSLQRK